MSDASKREFPSERFDAVYSRETILHIKDKKALFKNILVSHSGINFTSIISLFANLSLMWMSHTGSYTTCGVAFFKPIHNVRLSFELGVQPQQRILIKITSRQFSLMPTMMHKKNSFLHGQLILGIRWQAWGSYWLKVGKSEPSNCFSIIRRLI